MRAALIFIFTLFCSMCFSQSTETNLQSVIPVFRQVSYPFLPSITSDCFYFTSDGLMWFSTAKGLTSFDGTSVLYHSDTKQTNELDLNKIDAFAEDKNHNIYLGTRVGLIYFNRKQKKFMPISYAFVNSEKKQPTSIFSIYIDKTDIVYSGTGSMGVIIFNPKTNKTEHFNLDSSKPDNWENRNNNTVKSIAPHFFDNSLLWLGSFNGIYLFNKKTKTLKKNFTVKNPSADYDGSTKENYDVQKMEVFNDSTIWFNSWSGGLCKYNTNSGNVEVYLQKEIPGAGKNFKLMTLASFERIAEKYFFIGSQSNNPGLFDIGSKKFDPATVTGFKDAYDRISFATNDKHGNLWLLRNKSLYISVPACGRIQTTDIGRQLTPDNNANELRSIFYDTAVHRYYGAVRHSSGIYVFDRDLQLQEIIPAPLYTNSYTFKETCTDRITKDGSDRFWVTGHETYIKLPGQKKFDYIRNILPSLSWIEKKGEFFSLLTTKNGDVLIRGVSGDVFIINHKTLHTDTVKISRFVGYNGNYHVALSPLLYDSLRSLIYYSNDYGVAQCNLQTHAIKILQAAEFLGVDQTNLPIIKIALDDSGRIWAMRLNSGFRILDPLSLKCIDSFRIGERGLMPESYSNIVYGGKDYMFLQGQNGIVVYNYRRKQSFLFDNSNGLKLPIALSLLYSNRHLIVGQLNSVQFYNTDLFEKNNFTLFPRINIIAADTSIVYEREKNDSLNTIRLRYFQNNLRFSFSAPEFIFPERIEYAYQLADFENNWQYATYFKREVSYTRLPPGKYIFRLKAQMQGGNWEVAPVEYVINIKPAIWQTSLFKIIALALIVAAAVFVVRLRIQYIRKKEKQKASHEKELLELEAKALRAQMNPHFVFNCLNSIKSLIQDDQKDKSVTYLTTFSKLIRTLFNNADKKEISLYDEIETCKLYLQLEAMRFDSKFSYSVNVDETIDLKSVHVPALIIQPFIENAIWHGIVPQENGGHVSLNVTRSNGNIEIAVDDNGIGREASKQNKAKTNIGHQSKGVNLTQSRLELDNLLQQRQARLEIIDKKDALDLAAGTKVIITIKEET